MHANIKVNYIKILVASSKAFFYMGPQIHLKKQENFYMLINHLN